MARKGAGEGQLPRGVFRWRETRGGACPGILYVDELDTGRVRYLLEDDDPRIDEELRLKRQFDPEWWYVVEAALLTELRQGEQFGMRWVDVDFRAEVIHVPKTKSGESRHVPMHARVRQILEGLAARKRGVWVFVGASGRRLNGHTFALRKFKTALACTGQYCHRCALITIDSRLCSSCRAPLPDPTRDSTWHDLRHNMTSRLLMAGRDL